MDPKERNSSPLHRPLILSPWVFFLIFLFANTILAYVPTPLSTEIWVGFLGLVLPFCVGFWLACENRQKDPGFFSRELFQVSVWSGAFIVFLLIFLRLYRLTTLPVWPMGDEGIFSMLAMGLMRHWDGSLLLGEFRMEPMLLWTMAGFFHLAEPSITSLRLFTAFLSLATSLAAYWALRQFISRSFALAFCCLLSFSFPAILLGRQCTQNDLIPPWQWVAFGLLGLFLKSKHQRQKHKWLLALSLWCGLGFYAYINWFVVWLFILVILLVYCRERKFQAFFLFTSCGIAVPLALARLAPGNSTYIHHIYGGTTFIRSLSLYAEGLFWHGNPSYPLGPQWGGFLDSASVSLLGVGLISLVQYFSLTQMALTLGGLFVSLVPGLVTQGMELQRVTPVFPFLLGLAALGIQSLVKNTGKFQGWVLAGLLALPLGLNVYGFAGPYCDIHLAPPGRQWRAMEYHHAYQILEDLSRKTGPLYVFTEFSTDYDDKTLNLAGYPFNVLQNPRLNPAHALWAAVVVNIRYAPYFEKNFPGLRFEAVDPNYRPEDERTTPGLFLIPLSSFPPAMLAHWIEADEGYRDLNLNLKNKNPVIHWGDVPSKFGFLENRFPGDPFLTAIYWEKFAFFKVIEKDYPSAAQAYANAIKLGFPAGHLFYQWGLVLRDLGKESEAQLKFSQSRLIARQPIQNTASR